ncbi:hypothetical protein J3458_000854 [Metarhizium acridum]|uniref:uncharacterized protein n=1 Tax=Metarhizium acridum TaxID=92637 RepID=UPI001C6BBC45|nr:hypothetical protein J3458_000854 [Metarhizium acridum]
MSISTNQQIIENKFRDPFACPAPKTEKKRTIKTSRDNLANPTPPPAKRLIPCQLLADARSSVKIVACKREQRNTCSIPHHAQTPALSYSATPHTGVTCSKDKA